MFKLSKLLYAIVNQILPVPQDVLSWALECYRQFMSSEQDVKIYEEKLMNFALEKYYDITLIQKLKQNKIQLVFIKDLKNDGNFYKYSDYRIDINCVGLNQDKDVLQHQLKHYFQYWVNKYMDENLEQLHEFYNLQFQTYITDFCNLFTQIYKRLNRRFNVNLDTIIQKVVVDVIDGKLNIDKYKNLFNGISQFECYTKILSIMQLYKYGHCELNKVFEQHISKCCDIKMFKNQNKYNKFFEILLKHIKQDVKKSSEYNVQKAIKNKDFNLIDQMIQKRAIKNEHINYLVQFLKEQKNQKSIANLMICYNLTETIYNQLFCLLQPYYQQKVLKQKI